MHLTLDDLGQFHDLKGAERRISCTLIVTALPFAPLLGSIRLVCYCRRSIGEQLPDRKQHTRHRPVRTEAFLLASEGCEARIGGTLVCRVSASIAAE